MDVRWQEIVLAMMAAMLLLLVEHWGPWQQLLRCRFHQVVNYVLGVLALNAPLTVLLIGWGDQRAAIAVWVISVGGGLAVGVAYAVDGWIGERNRRIVAEREAELFRPGADHDPRSSE